MPHRSAIARACTLSPNSSRISGARTNEGDSLLGAAARERRVLAQKAITGMNRVAAGFLGDRDDALTVEIGFGAGAFERDGVIGFAGM